MSFRNILKFDFSNIRGDLFGGLTAGIVALPLALAFGLQSGLGASAGLYGAIFIAFVAALFGGTPTQISGPTAPMTAVSMVVIGGIIAANDGDVSKALPSILIVFVLAGLFQIFLGFIKVGQYIRFIPYPVVSGFMSGIGVIIFVTQLLPLVGYYPGEDKAYVDKFVPQAEEVLLDKILKEEAQEEILVLEHFEETVRRAKLIKTSEIDREAKVLAKKDSSGVLGAIKSMGRAIGDINYIDLILGLLTIGIIYGFKRITTAIPSTLVALIAVSLGAFLLLDDYRTIGTIPSGFPKFHWDIIANFEFSAIRPYIFTAVSLGVLGAIDSLLTSIVADNKTKTKHNPNQELIGQGIGNAVAALFGGIPGAGATIRTVVNIDAGGRTKISGVVAGLLLLVMLLVVGPIASKIPAAVLAGILITVGIGVMDWKGLSRIGSMPKSEVAVMLIVLGLTVFVGLIEAVGVGLILASLLFMKIIADVIDNRTYNAPLRDFSREAYWADEASFPKKFENKVFIKHLDGPLFFGFAARFQEMMSALPDVKYVVMRMDKVPYMDQSGLHALEDAIEELIAQGVTPLFTDLHGQPLDLLQNVKAIPTIIKPEHCFKDFKECLEWLKAEIKE